MAGGSGPGGPRDTGRTDMRTARLTLENADERMVCSVWCWTFKAVAAVLEGADYTARDSIPSGHTSYALKPTVFTV